MTNSRGERCITSVEIAELTGKAHNHVVRDIRSMEQAWTEVHQSKFGQMQIREQLPNNGYRMKSVYVLTKLESLYIITKYNDRARARLLLRWAELEGKQLQEEQEELKRLETEDEILRRSDNILRRQISAENEDAAACYTFTEIARSLGVDRKWLTNFLKVKNVIIWVAGRYELQAPYDRMNLVRYRHHQGYSLEGNRKKREYMVWTPEGKDFVTELCNRE